MRPTDNECSSVGRTQLSDTGVGDELTVVGQVTRGVAGQGPVDEGRYLEHDATKSIATDVNSGSYIILISGMSEGGSDCLLSAVHKFTYLIKYYVTDTVTLFEMWDSSSRGFTNNYRESFAIKHHYFILHIISVFIVILDVITKETRKVRQKE